ncbi:MAG: hypothetical protein HYT16_03760 [DPANN group archaeon]|nr:hypothetical protein [DPANN group archaeon]
MSFIQYAAEQGQLAILESGIFLVDGGAPALQAGEGDRLEKRVDGFVLSWPLRSVDFNSLWTAHARANQQALEKKINLAASEVIHKPLDLVKESRLSLALKIDASYVSLLKEILFNSGVHLTKIPDKGESLDVARTRRREEYLNYLENRLGTEAVEFDPAKLRSLVQNFIDIMRDRPLSQFDAVMRKKIKHAIGSGPGFLISGGGAHALKAAPAPADVSLYINGITYVLGEVLVRPDIDSVFIDYAAEFAEAQGIKRAAGRASEIDIGVDRRELGILMAALKKGIGNVTLDMGDWGVVLNEGTITVHINIPEYALRDWKSSARRCYLMPACKVAVRAYLNTKKAEWELTAPFALGGAPNPFVNGQSICLGTASSNLTVDLPLYLRIVKYLSEGHKIITTGYGRGDSHPYHRLSSVSSKLIRTEEELQKAGIPITNEVNL